ncbi:MAG: WbqC family protein [Microscillaceae bacterium]|nr:WbqC family protein [Microscillaceae bacterium]
MMKVSGKAAILDLYYLPCLEYWAAFFAFEQVLIDVGAYFEKQTYRNRCLILTAQGVMSLSVPVCKITGKQALKEVRIDYRQRWSRHHWRSFQAAYGKAPFFEYYQDDFRAVFEQEVELLWQLNWKLLTICRDILQVPAQVEVSEKYLEFSSENHFEDLRGAFSPQDFGDKSRRFGTPEYIQVFGKRFVGNLCILDLIFCEGPNAGNLIRQSL